MSIAAYLGCTPAALRLLLGVLCGYPMAITYRRIIASQTTVIQHAYFASTGLALVIFNYGWDTIHSFSNIAFVYVVMLLAGRTRAGLAVSFLFTMGYLLVGYLYTATENYDIKWTMPHCILCLRLIGVAFDYYDGGVEDQSEPPHARSTALKTLPSPLEVFGHLYFFGGCMVGPQFPLKRYREFVEGRLWPHQKLQSADSVPYSIKRLLLGLGMMVFYQLGIAFANDKVLLSDEFLHSWSLTARWLFLGVYSAVVLQKYVACWLLATTTNFDGIIRSFNINTNKWIAQHIFKRLRFLGKKDISHLSALLFLALWHGFHIGYYICFIMEFLVIKFERDVSLVIDRFPTVRAIIYHDKLRWVRLVFMKFYVACLFGFCLVPFSLLKLSKIHKVYSSFYYFPVIVLAGWLLASSRVMPMLKNMGSRQETAGKGTALKKE